MKIKNFQKFFSIISTSTVIILLLDLTQFVSSSCSVNDLQLVGTKSFCEESNGYPISCSTNSNEIKKAYITCENGYFNEHNIQQQIIECNEDGKWSEDVLECLPECTDTIRTLRLWRVRKLKYPTSYVQIVRKIPVRGKLTKLSGMIISLREIVTKARFIKNENINDFIIKIPITSTEFIDHTLGSINCDNSNERRRFDQLCVLNLPDNEFIKYNDNIKPACSNITNLREFSETSFLNNTISKHIYKTQKSDEDCYVPSVDTKKIDMKCYTMLPYFIYQPVQCSTRAQIITKRCQIGYRNILAEKKLIDKNNNNKRDLVSRCDSDKWNIFGDDEDCQMVCGNINTNYKPGFKHLLYQGTKTDIIVAPWHVGIFSNNTKSSATYQQICGGTIIHSNIVISAAHCFYDTAYDRLFNESNYLVGAGKRYRSYEISEPYDRYSTIKNIEIPPTYQHQPVANDIAILVLTDHFKYSSHIKPVCIDWQSYDNYDITEGTMGSVFGWGATSKLDPSSSELLTVNFTVLTNEQCKKLVDPNLRSEITADKFCATNDEKASACQGDSGGGFYTVKEINKNEYRYFLSGVVSLGIDTTKYCSAGFLTVFANIQFYQDLIKRTIAITRDLTYDEDD